MQFLNGSTINNLPPKASDKLRVVVDEAFANLEVERKRRASSSTADSILIGLYMKLISDIAGKLGIGGLAPLTMTNQSSLLQFQGDVERVINILQLGEGDSAVRGLDDAVTLPRKTKSWLRQEVEQLGTYIDDVDIPGWKKDAVKKRIADLLAEINREKTDIARILSIAASISTILGVSGGLIAKAPQIAGSLIRIQEVVGWELVEEDILDQLSAPEPTKAITYNPTSVSPD